MDLSFSLKRDFAYAPLSSDLAVLLVGVTARQAASPTARVQTLIDHVGVRATLLAPADGAFNRAASGTVTSGKPR